MRIALIDDDPLVARTIQLNWPEPDDVIECFSCYEDAWGPLFARSHRPVDCVILDLQAPDTDGSEVLADIRRTSAIPVIVVSGWGDGDFRAQLLLQGADDYLLKPLSAKELHARILRIMNPRGFARPPGMLPVMIGTVSFNASGRRLVGPTGCSETLTEAEAALLDALAFAQGRPVAREELYLRAFGRSYNEGDKSLETYIGRLRKKLSTLGENGAGRVLTARNIGYRINLLP